MNRVEAIAAVVAPFLIAALLLAGICKAMGWQL